MKAKKAPDIDALVAAAVPPRPNPQLAFTMPGLRVDSHTNSREGWKATWARGKMEKKTLFDAWRAATNKGMARPVSVPCVVRLIRVGPKGLDSEDNLREAFKTIKDAIAYTLFGGVNRMGVDDGSELIKWEYAQVAVGKRVYSVRVEVY